MASDLSGAMTTRRQLVIAALILLCCNLCTVAKADTETVKPRSVDELLSQYRASLDSMLDTYSFKSRSRLFEMGGVLQSEAWVKSCKGDFVRKKDRWRYLVKECGNKLHAGGLHPYARIHEHSFDAMGNYTRVTREYEVPRVIDNLDSFTFQSLVQGPLIVKTSLEDDSLLGRNGFAFHRLTRPIFGHLPFDGNRSFVDILVQDGPEVVEWQQSIQGHACWKVVSSGPYGERSISLDPSADYLPRRIWISKKGKDIHDNTDDKKLLRQQSKRGSEYRRPFAQLESYTCELRDVVLQKTSGSYWISGFELVQTERYRSGQELRSREVVEFELVTFEPASEALKLATPIPDGTSVDVRNAPAIDCEWRGGQIVRLVDDSVISNLSDVEFRAERSASRSWLLIANVTVILAIVALIAYRRMQPTNNTAIFE